MAGLTGPFMDAVVETFSYTKGMGEGVLRQVSGEEIGRVVGPDFNSIAVIVKHMRGNMLSRWTDFLTSDGEKPWRGRDDEFVEEAVSKDLVMGWWDEGWACVLGAIEGLGAEDLEKTVRIRGVEHSVPRAILRQVEHYGYHVGQMVLIGKMLKGNAWETLTVPRGGSEGFNREMGYGAGEGTRH